MRHFAALSLTAFLTLSPALAETPGEADDTADEWRDPPEEADEWPPEGGAGADGPADTPSWATCEHFEAVLRGNPGAELLAPAPAPMGLSSGLALPPEDDEHALSARVGMRLPEPVQALEVSGQVLPLEEDARLESVAPLASEEWPPSLVALVWVGVAGAGADHPDMAPPEPVDDADEVVVWRPWEAYEAADVELRLYNPTDTGWELVTTADRPPHGETGPFGGRWANRQIPNYRVAAVADELVVVTRSYRRCQGADSICEALDTAYLYELRPDEAGEMTLHRLGQLPYQAYTGAETCAFEHAAFAYRYDFLDLDGDGGLDVRLWPVARLEIERAGEGRWELGSGPLSLAPLPPLHYLRQEGRLVPVEELALDFVISDYNRALRALEGNPAGALEAMLATVETLEALYSFEVGGENALRCLGDDDGYCGACATAEVRIHYDLDEGKLLEVIVGAAAVLRRLEGMLGDAVGVEEARALIVRLGGLLQERDVCWAD